MKRKKCALALLAALFLTSACAGCAAGGADRLYALPRLTDEYVELEELISQRIRDGGEYAAPAGGGNRQSVQLRDLDGDGAEEAVAFLADSTRTPNVCVYRQNADGDYYLFVAIEGAGSAVDSVEYADLNGDGGQELILSWQIGGDLRLLSVYALGPEQQTQLLSVDSSEFVVCDLDGNGTDELLNLDIDIGGVSTLTRYVFAADGTADKTEARLSDGIEEVLRVRTGYLSDESTALFVESRWGEDGLITDVFAADGDGVRNITLSGSRSSTLREGGAFAADINADRITELPEPIGDVLEWYCLDPFGYRTPVLSTYHDYDAGWYLILPELLRDGELTAIRADSVPGEETVTFTADGAPALRIYILTGENRLDRAGEEGRFVLVEDGATVYAAELLDDTLTQEEVNFNLIYPEWQTGDLG